MKILLTCLVVLFALSTHANEGNREMESDHFKCIIKEALPNIDIQNAFKVGVISSPYLSDQIAIFRVDEENAYFDKLEASDYRSENIMELVSSWVRDSVPQSQYSYREIYLRKKDISVFLFSFDNGENFIIIVDG